MQKIDLPIHQPYTTVEDVLVGLGSLEEIFTSRDDKRGVFISAYLEITRELERRINARVFEDSLWLGRYVAAFADLYRQALLAFEEGLETVPKPWRIAFEAAQNGSTLIQDLILGINAHINHDLPLALKQVSLEPDQDSRYRDHTSVNEALKEATNPVQERIKTLYAPGLGFLDIAGGEVDEVLTNFSFEKAREAAWLSGVSLVGAETTGEFDRLRKAIEDRSAVLASLVLRPNQEYPWLARALSWLERLGTRGPTIVSTKDLGIFTHEESQPVVSSLDEVIARLESLIKRFDGEGSRLSVYPTVYIDVTRRVKRAIEDGLFEDPAWLERLDLLFASQYFRVIERFESDERDRIPRCWLVSLDAITGEETLVLQDLVLSVNARLNHDLGIALYQAGLFEENTESRTRDFKRIHDIFEASINPVQDILAGKYSRLLRIADIVGASLDETIVDFLYTKARDAALENAQRLADCGSDQDRETARQGMDHFATQLAQKVMLRGVVGGNWVMKALREIESRFEGAWSGWLEDGRLPGLYQRVLKEDFDRLPPQLLSFHGDRYGGRASGILNVTRGQGWAHRMAGRVLGLPDAGEHVPIRLEVVVEGERERWYRFFNEQPVWSNQWAKENLLVEKTGAGKFSYRLSTDGTSLEFHQEGAWLWFLPIPQFASPQTFAKMTARDGGWELHVTLRAPILGLLLRYEGFVRPE